MSGKIYRFCNWLFVIGVVTQVFLAGLVVVAAKSGWNLHETLGHLIGLPMILMLITAYTGKASAQIKRTTWILFVVYFLQADVLIFMRTSSFVPAVYLSAFHPVMALVDFWLGVKLLRGDTAS